ncbi:MULTISPECIES: response regulator transcription factor [unclassified Mucilaginibacter]|uniref:response regulator transcription factor n=1 Tax=unclassified Mucilaginibacter TaxID=2617802 RepID=UPI00095AB6EF|nr:MULTISPECIES: response regulator transcription factor [unclassified Mucilaginibacter]OJW13284.1 MAG: DNA-binding response regulator [Mucilaginibacter sp. 44-25]PLW88569.1 MAG: DNA-binding response regulator [Mucilaginibacter sp.]HEK21759.1 response regulator transcription factor [Bacteroidota bacterium]
MNILLVEDEAKVSAFIKRGLEEQSYNVISAYDGKMGVRLALENDFQLVILDGILPEVNGFDVCKQIRQFKRELPILMLSALGTVKDKVLGLENGADDYLTKPFHFEELLARVRALDRRRQNILPGTVYRVADLEIDSFKKTVTRGDKLIMLTVKEYTLLETLVYNKNRVLSRTYIAESVWGINFDRGTNLIDVYINYLRAKIDKGHGQQLIQTVVGMGYMISDQT